jgi:hypothetical protein
MLFGPEDDRNHQQRDLVLIKLVDIVEPKLVFHKDCQSRIDGLNELFGVFPGVSRQVKYIIGFVVIFSDLVAGRGKKGEQNLVVAELLFDLFYYRAGLFKFSETCHMEPDDFVIGVDGLLQLSEDVLSAFNPKFCFFVEQ